MSSVYGRCLLSTYFDHIGSDSKHKRVASTIANSLVILEGRHWMRGGQRDLAIIVRGGMELQGA